MPRSPGPTAPTPPGQSPPADLSGLVPPAPDVAAEPAYALPPPVSRPIDSVGAIWPGTTGFPATAFAGASGPYLTTLMQRLDAPIASRWVAIVLRRALLSSLPAAHGTRPADWVAERALLLVRLGDVDAARMLVQAVPVDRYTPRLYAVAAQVALAGGDIGGLCPIADVGQSLTKETLWPLARAMCAGLSGDTSLAAALIDDARQRRLIGNPDLLLVEQIAGAGTGNQKNASIDWTAVNRLTVFRFGLAVASGVPVPSRLFTRAGPQVQAWYARSPMVGLEQRIAAARAGAALGMISSADLVGLYAALAEDTDSFALASTPAGQLRRAYVEQDSAERIEAMEKLWAGDIRMRDGYAGRILTARAAAGIEPASDLLGRAPGLIASMLSAGLDRQAARWWPVLAKGDFADVAEGWALLAVGMPDSPRISENRIREWADRDLGVRGRHRAALFVAALAGLGRIDTATAGELSGLYGARLGETGAYLRQIDQAAAAGRGGEVALLAATGMQTPFWAGVPPHHLYHILAALRRVGREPEARMIAAEALMRS